MFTLGQKARDKVTGIEGILTGHCRHLTGCDTYGIQPLAKDGKAEPPTWFDETRIDIIGEGVTLNAAPTVPVSRPMNGGPQDTPSGRSAGNPGSVQRGPV